MLEAILYIVFTITALLLAVVSKQLIYSFKHYTPARKYSKLAQESDLPSVSVCIPARNEGHALTDCLQLVVDSTYQKLEIIVLDDISSDDTSALIKSFASEGVRFVKGTPLPSEWLGKNHALQGLLNEASGSYILFMDVDTRLAPNAIENTVRYAIENRAAMVSVLPRRQDGWRASVVFSPLRYFWELLFNRRTSPASASNAWLIRRDILNNQFNGFIELKNAIQPEALLADQLLKTNQYKFLISSRFFGVYFEKKWRSQLVTSTRLLFPLLNKRFINALVAIVGLFILLVPYVVLANAAFEPFNTFHALAAFLCLVQTILYGLYAYRVWQKGWLLGAIIFPYLLVQEIALIIASCIQYKRKAITWKGRPIQSEVQN